MRALLIIDMQNDFVLPGSPVTVAGALATVPRIRRLLDAFRARGWPVLHITRAYRADGSDVERFRREDFLRGPQYLLPGTSGADIVEELQPVPGEHVLIKPRFSAFMGTPLDLRLRRLGVDELVVSGTQYPNCIRATVLDAVCLDYAVTLVTDACSARTDAVAQANIADMAAIGVDCRTARQFLTGIA
ncbi:cysteine hydrolase family protein [Immundisolibacter cernigliae]|uniref:Isochorismatase n=1 Tax=Immundisolibacter cernigliae TaxID=1810504 RepID=A0A1B1YXN5_9GAMM|nr:isochorismatase family cysteine hydrolase [Immundisolibacter cernigliae]ANX05403.1 isochorismatase [Immundisolibacter cernigliae]